MRFRRANRTAHGWQQTSEMTPSEGPQAETGLAVNCLPHYWLASGVFGTGRAGLRGRGVRLTSTTRCKRCKPSGSKGKAGILHAPLRRRTFSLARCWYSFVFCVVCLVRKPELDLQRNVTLVAPRALCPNQRRHRLPASAQRHCHCPPSPGALNLRIAVDLLPGDSAKPSSSAAKPTHCFVYANPRTSIAGTKASTPPTFASFVFHVLMEFGLQLRICTSLYPSPNT